MASIVVGVLRALLTADTAKFDSGMREASNSLKGFSKEWQRAGQQMSQVGRTMTATVTLPILGAVTAAAKLAIDFESSFAGVRKTVDATEAEFKQMSQAFRDLSKTIPINVNELNRLGEAAGALGIPKAAIVDFAKVMALLGQTTNVTADQAAESIAKIQNIFGAAGKDTDRFAATLVDLGNNGASTESQILDMATRIAGAGNVIGLTQGEVLGFASALSSVGLEAEAGGTAISKTFIEMAVAVNKGGADLMRFAGVAGMTAAAFKKQFETDAAGAATAFIDGMGRIKASGGDLIGTLTALGFTEVRQRDALLRVAGAGDLVRASLHTQAKAWQDNTALTEEARKRFETTASQLTLLWNRLKDVGITIGAALLPTIKALVKSMDTVIPMLERMANLWAGLPVGLQASIVGFGLLVAAVGPVLFVLGQLTIAATAIAGLFSGPVAASILTASRALVTFGGVIAVFTASFALGTWLEQNTAAARRFSDAFQFAALRLQGYTAEQADAMINTTHATEAALKRAKAADTEASSVGASAGASEAAAAAARINAVHEAAAAAAALKAAAAAAQAEAAQKKYAAALADVNLKIKVAHHDVGQLTEAQKREVDALDQLGLSAQEIGIKLGLSNLAIQDYLELSKEAARADGVRQKALQELTGSIEEHMAAVGKQIDQRQEQIALFTQGQQLDMIPTLDDQLTPNAMIAEGPDTSIGRWGEHGVKMGRAIGEGLQRAFQGIPDLLMRAFTGGGGFGGALKAIGVQMGEAIVKPMLDAMLKRIAAAKLGQAVAGAFGMGSAVGGGGGAGQALGAAASIGSAAAGGGAGGGAGAGGAAATVGGGIGLGTTLAITGGVAGGALLAWAIWKKGLFRGGEESLKVSPRRDKFLAQFGGLAQLGELVFSRTKSDQLVKNIAAAQHVPEFEKAQSAIVAALGARRFSGGMELPPMHVKSFATGGFVPPGTVVPAMLHGGLHGEDITPRTSAGGGGSIIINIQASAIDAAGMDKVFAKDIIPRMKNALVFNQGGLLSTTQRTVR